MKKAITILIWFVAVATFLPAIAVLYIGILGYPVNSNQAVSAFLLAVLGSTVVLPLSAIRSINR